MKILCFGDSNTYGYIPGGTGRYDEKVRYPKVMEKILGEDFTVYEEGLCGRTTIFDKDDFPGRRGVDYVGATVDKYQPDILIVMLGTNDCKTQFETDEEKISQGLEEVVQVAIEGRNSNASMKVILVSPITIDPIALQKANYYNEFSIEVSEKMANSIARLAESKGYGFVDAASVAKAHKDDGEHLDQDGHRNLAKALVKEVEKYVELRIK